MDLSVPGAVDTDGQQAQPQPPPRLLEPLGQEERETFAARPGRTLTEPTAAAEQQALENEGSRASLGITEVEPDDKQQETLCCCTVIDLWLLVWLFWVDLNPLSLAVVLGHNVTHVLAK